MGHASLALAGSPCSERTKGRVVRADEDVVSSSTTTSTRLLPGSRGDGHQPSRLVLAQPLSSKSAEAFSAFGT